ncbi:MAG TPA: Sec-independent protein translocase subunit TatA [Pseudonocardia sp.]|jgi:sec-independent protein translocase protein TatA|nr:Sec-independent protein translocase subunit TatA [Pseudonocardia sp.]
MPGGWELLIIVAVIVLLFGAKKLPAMARSVGQSARIFKGEMKGLKDENPEAAPDVPATPAALPPGPTATASAPVGEGAHPATSR